MGRLLHDDVLSVATATGNCYTARGHTYRVLSNIWNTSVCTGCMYGNACFHE